MNFSLPTSSYGYYRGSPLAGGGAQSSGGYGNQMAGNNQFAAGQGPQAESSAWSPTVLYMFGLIILEMIVFGILASKL